MCLPILCLSSSSKKIVTINYNFRIKLTSVILKCLKRLYNGRLIDKFGGENSFGLSNYNNYMIMTYDYNLNV